MALYVITATRIVNYNKTIDANSEAEALAIADQTDPELFDEVGHEFTIDYAEEIK
jgi:hypothetical protein